MIDKADIFACITKRNALRIANRLPPLDVRAEYDHAVAVASQRDYQAICDEHTAEREAIRIDVLAQLWERHGPNFGTSFGGRGLVNRVTQQRFVAYIAEKYRVHHEDAGRNSIIYGEASKRDV